MSEEINKLIECLKDNIPVDYTRSCDSSDGIGHYDEDEDSWQYQLYNYITNLQQENQQLKEKINKIDKHVSGLSSVGRGCEIYADVKREILKVVRGDNK